MPFTRFLSATYRIFRFILILKFTKNTSPELLIYNASFKMTGYAYTVPISS